MTRADLDASTFQHANNDVTRICHSIAQASALDAASDAGILGGFVDVLHGLEGFSDASYALAHDLAGTELVARIKDVSVANIIRIETDALGDHVHDAFHRE